VLIGGFAADRYETVHLPGPINRHLTNRPGVHIEE
jgi:hypothetical protein